MLFQLIQIAYWLALSTWFGGVLFVAIAAPVIFRTVRESNPLLPEVLSVNLEHQHGTLLAGAIVGNLLRMLMRVQLVCAGLLFIALGAQWFLVNLHDRSQLITIILRTALYVAAVILMAYDSWMIATRMWRHRQEYLDHADEPDVANPAKDQFDHYHRESVTILGIVLFLLLGMILFSGSVSFTQTLVAG